MLNNMSIKNRLILLVCVIMVLGSIVATAAFIALSNLQAATKDIAERRITLIRDVNKVLLGMEENRSQILRAGQHDPANPASKLHDHPVTKHLDAIVANKSVIDEHFAELETLTHSAEGKALLKELAAARATFVSEGLVPASEAIRAGNYMEASMLISKKVNPLMDAAAEVGHKQAAHENESAKQSTAEAMAAAHTAEWTIVVGMLFMGAVAAVLGYSIISGVSRSTSEMRDVMTRMAADGDLSRRVTIHGQDEVGQAATAFNSLIDGFANIIRMVVLNANTVANTAANLSTSSLQISQGSQAQSSAAASTAAAVEEMTVSISSVAANTEDVRKLSERSLEQTEQGNENVHLMVGEIHRVQEAVNQIAGSVKEFVDSTRAIAGMTQQVKDIANQTNLLALNAAIEAARAGEQGRGFAVVADEVRKLAEKSAQSANEIDQVTSSLNGKSTHVEATVQQGLRSLQTTEEQVERVSTILAEAGRAVTQSSSGVNDIASAVTEQSLATTEIARNVESIAQMSEENYAAVQSNSQDIVRLEGLARDLQGAVSRFKV